jgi:cation diffusion facilitator family transporter
MIGRSQSIRYVSEDEAPVLRFASLERGGLDESEDVFRKNSSLFLYNSEEDIYRLNSLKKSRLTERSINLGISHQNSEENNMNANIIKQKSSSKNNDVMGGNVINIDFKGKKLSPLYIIMLCYLLFCIIELICGYYSNSITLMADAAHYFSESSCFGIFIISVYISRKGATNDMPFGFHRGEIIGALVRATFLLGFSFWLIYYTTLSFIRPTLANGLMIIILGIVSTFFNVVMGLVLIIFGIGNGVSYSEKAMKFQHQHSDDELNCNSVRKTYTNIIFNGIQSCIIIVAGILIYFLPLIKFVDPICTLLLTGVLLYNAYIHFEGIVVILLECSPLEFNVKRLKKDLLSVKGVIEVHDIHVWSLNVGKLSMSCHLITSEPQDSLLLANELVKKKYNITHTTIQVELNKDNKEICKENSQ